MLCIVQYYYMSLDRCLTAAFDDERWLGRSRLYHLKALEISDYISTSVLIMLLLWYTSNLARKTLASTRHVYVTVVYNNSLIMSHIRDIRP